MTRTTRKSTRRHCCRCDNNAGYQDNDDALPGSSCRDKYEDMPFAVKTRRGEMRPNLALLFAYLNNRYFDEALREFSPRYVPNMVRSYGYTSKYERIVNISWTLHRMLRREQFATLMGTLLHEMCHVYLYLYDTGVKADRENESHGPSFMRLLHRIEARAQRFGHRYHILAEPPNAERDIKKKRSEFTWRCRQCGELRSTVVSRDINNDGVLSRHTGCARRDVWIRHD